MSFVYRVYEKGGEVLLTIADEELLKKRVGSCIVSEFYGEDSIGEEVIELFKKATSANLLGERIVSLAVDKGYIDKDRVCKVEGIPHALFFKV